MRLACIRDEPAILDLLIADLEENARQVAPISLPRLTELIATATRGGGGFCLVVDDAKGQPCALAILALGSWWWSETSFLQETVLYVSPEARYGHIGADLIQGEKYLAEQMSEAAGERIYLLAGVTATRRMEAKMRLYGRKLTQVGAFYVHPPIDGGLSL